MAISVSKLLVFVVSAWIACVGAPAFAQTKLPLTEIVPALQGGGYNVLLPRIVRTPRITGCAPPILTSSADPQERATIQYVCEHGIKGVIVVQIKGWATPRDSLAEAIVAQAPVDIRPFSGFTAIRDADLNARTRQLPGRAGPNQAPATAIFWDVARTNTTAATQIIVSTRPWQTTRFNFTPPQRRSRQADMIFYNLRETLLSQIGFQFASPHSAIATDMALAWLAQDCLPFLDWQGTEDAFDAALEARPRDRDKSILDKTRTPLGLSYKVGRDEISVHTHLQSAVDAARPRACEAVFPNSVTSSMLSDALDAWTQQQSVARTRWRKVNAREWRSATYRLSIVTGSEQNDATRVRVVRN